MKLRSLFVLLAVVALVVVGQSAIAQTSVVSFPDLPEGTSWVTGLTTLFAAAAGLGLGILGLRFVIRMIAAGLAARKARG